MTPDLHRPGQLGLTPADRLGRSYVVEPSGCWQWLGRVATNGYGQLSIRRHEYRAHRLMYELLVGPIATGLTIDHLCRNRKCVNPDHLEPVTHRENVRRGLGAKLTAAQVELIRSARGRVGVRALARTLGVHYSTVSRVGRGLRWSDIGIPTAEWLEAAARVLGKEVAA